MTVSRDSFCLQQAWRFYQLGIKTFLRSLSLYFISQLRLQGTWCISQGGPRAAACFTPGGNVNLQGSDNLWPSKKVQKFGKFIHRHQQWRRVFLSHLLGTPPCWSVTPIDPPVITLLCPRTAHQPHAPWQFLYSNELLYFILCPNYRQGKTFIPSLPSFSPMLKLFWLFSWWLTPHPTAWRPSGPSNHISPRPQTLLLLLSGGSLIARCVPTPSWKLPL